MYRLISTQLDLRITWSQHKIGNKEKTMPNAALVLAAMFLSWLSITTQVDLRITWSQHKIGNKEETMPNAALVLAAMFVEHHHNSSLFLFSLD